MPFVKRTLALLVLALPLLGCGRESEHSPKPVEPPLVRGVTVGTVASADLAESVEVTGTVKSRTTTTLSSKIVARIVTLHAREGGEVRAGQLLVELDDADIAAQLRRAEAGLAEAEAAVGEVDRAIAAARAARTAAEAQLELATATVSRYRTLFERKSVAPQEYDQVAARHKAAEADVERAAAEGQALQARRQQVLARIESAKAEIGSVKVMREHAKIVAPIDGVVTIKHADVGSLAAPGAPILTVEDNRRYWLEAAVPASLAGGIRRGQSLRVAIEAAGVDAAASVREILPAADPATRTTIVRLDLASNAQLRAGLFGRAWVPAGRRQVLQVARAAVVERGQLQGVYVVGQDDIARFRLIRTGATAAGAVEVISGLSDGERIVLVGADRVSDGVRVQK